MAGYYLPSVKGGGPIQSIKNLVDNLSDEFNFYIVAADRDLGDDTPFDGIETNNWINVGKANVYYTNMKSLTWKKTECIIKDTQCKILYLNSFFAFKDSIIPILLHKFNRISDIKIVLAPRGQFSNGALGLKNCKKKIFIKFALLLNLYKRVSWHATTILEKEDIEKVFGTDISIEIAENLTPNYKNTCYSKNFIKKSGELKLVYISRIHPMKNLLQVIEILKRFDDKIDFNIYGPIEDENYWEKCKKTINQLNDNLEVNYHGLISNDKVNQIYKSNHVSILLTLGENFGHSISEALIGGCPLIISDRTPWQNIASYKSGWDISLENSDLIAEKIKYFLELDNDEYSIMSRNAFEYGRSRSNQRKDLNSYYKILDINN